MNVRLARPKDADDIFDLLEMMHEEAGQESLDEPKSRAKIAELIERGFVGIIDEDHRPVATIGLGFGQSWYSSETHLCDFWTYVHPDYRRSTHAKKLIQFGDAVGKEMKMKLYMGVTSTDRTRAKCALFSRVLKPIGETFVGGAI